MRFTLLLFLLFFGRTYAQNTSEFDIKNHKIIDSVSIVLSEKTENIDYLNSLHAGSYYKNDKNFVCVSKISTIKQNRVKYIYLDTKDYSIQKINEIRKEIITNYNKGISFHELNVKFSSYKNKEEIDSDLGWFQDGQMEKNFEEGIKKHKKDEIFTIDIPKKNWYYVVLKTHDETETKKIDFYIYE